MNDSRQQAEQTAPCPEETAWQTAWQTPDYVIVDTALEVTAYALTTR
ncbi:pyrroloquinoline quinone precursor peptide PqqA [Streptomyces sp. XD-27]|nr:pyrroloquinoline quinone precursor peptide PqqA [Streptomyces sp. XD-27]WKX68856.1 pyrroloquinoline quinone precursor peptide PqqA [Streptomyces sp. XD-27]